MVGVGLAPAACTHLALSTLARSPPISPLLSCPPSPCYPSVLTRNNQIAE